MPASTKRTALHQRHSDCLHQEGKSGLWLVLRLLLLAIIAIATVPGVVGSLNDDIKTLIAVVRANPSFNYSGSWVPGAHISTWQGVYACEDPSPSQRGGQQSVGDCISGLYMTGCSPVHPDAPDGFEVVMKGPIPAELAALANLTMLGLHCFNLNGPIPPELAELANLQLLDLSYNHLSGPIPPELAELANLNSLKLPHNDLSGPIPEELGNLGLMKKLDLSYNWLNGSIPHHLGRLRNLESLNLANNQLEDATPFMEGAKQLMPKLSEVTLDHNPLRPWDLANLLDMSRFPLLRDVHITPCNWGKPQSYFKELCAQTRVDFGGLHSWESDLWEDGMSCMCFPRSPESVVAILWSIWLALLIVALLVPWLGSRSSWVRSRMAPPAPGADITAFAVLKYLGGLISTGLLMGDYITDVLVVIELSRVGLWFKYFVLFFTVLQHVISGLMLSRRCWKAGTWPLGGGQWKKNIKWAWKWRGTVVMVPSASKVLVGHEGSTQPDSSQCCKDVCLWFNLLCGWLVLGLPWVIFLDVCSVLALKVGLWLYVNSKPVVLSDYWDSRNLTQVIFQSIPQSVFQSILLLMYKAFITAPQQKHAFWPPAVIQSLAFSLSGSLPVIAFIMSDFCFNHHSNNSFLMFVYERFWSLAPYYLEKQAAASPAEDSADPSSMLSETSSSK